MSVKNLTMLFVAGVATLGATAAMAGGPDYAPASSASSQAVYFEADGGWVSRNWTSFASNTALSYSTASNVKHGRGSWSLGGALGYQANDMLAVELGYWKPESAKGTNYSTSALTKIKSWFAYTAVKGTMPIASGTALFGKLGVANVHNKAENNVQNGAGLTSTAGSSVSSNYYNVLLGAGLQFDLGCPNWVANAQYMYIPGNYSTPSDKFTAPAISVYSVGVAYKMMI